MLTYPDICSVCGLVYNHEFNIAGCSKYNLRSYWRLNIALLRYSYIKKSYHKIVFFLHQVNLLHHCYNLVT